MFCWCVTKISKISNIIMRLKPKHNIEHTKKLKVYSNDSLFCAFWHKMISRNGGRWGRFGCPISAKLDINIERVKVCIYQDRHLTFANDKELQTLFESWYKFGNFRHLDVVLYYTYYTYYTYCTLMRIHIQHI